MQKSACYIILLQFGVIHQSRITFLSANVIDVTDSFPFRFFFGMMHTGGPISGTLPGCDLQMWCSHPVLHTTVSCVCFADLEKSRGVFENQAA